MLILGVGLVSFAMLTVVIEEDVLRIRFGPGVIRNDFSLKDVESCHVVKTPWYYDWGIHLALPGRLYNVSGYYAIEIKMKTGKKCRIGTDVPDDLETAIRRSMKKTVSNGA